MICFKKLSVQLVAYLCFQASVIAGMSFKDAWPLLTFEKTKISNGVDKEAFFEGRNQDTGFQSVDKYNLQVAIIRKCVDCLCLQVCLIAAFYETNSSLFLIAMPLVVMPYEAFIMPGYEYLKTIEANVKL